MRCRSVGLPTGFAAGCCGRVGDRGFDFGRPAGVRGLIGTGLASGARGFDFGRLAGAGVPEGLANGALGRAAMERVGRVGLARSRAGGTN